MKIEVEKKLYERLEEEQKEHIDNMQEILNALSDKDLIFKGGSALLFAYKLDRFSEDLDFDATYSLSAKSIINSIKRLNNVKDISVKKDTDITKRVMVEFVSGDKVKVEISLRNLQHEQESSNYVEFFNNLKVYSINELLKLKLNALKSRFVARDLYDIGFILDNYFDKIEINLLEESNKIIDNDVMKITIDYEEAFEEDKVLDYEDLFLTAQRLERFRKKYENNYMEFAKISESKAINRNNNNQVKLKP